ncbi:unnamed protein product, partial [Polarella glacialis]
PSRRQPQPQQPRPAAVSSHPEDAGSPRPSSAPAASASGSQAQQDRHPNGLHAPTPGLAAKAAARRLPLARRARPAFAGPSSAEAVTRPSAAENPSQNLVAAGRPRPAVRETGVTVSLAVPESWDEQDVQEICHQYSSVARVELLTAGKFQVTFASSAMAKAAVRGLQNLDSRDGTGFFQLQASLLDAAGPEARADSLPETRFVYVDQLTSVQSQLISGPAGSDTELFLWNLPLGDSPSGYSEKELQEWLEEFGPLASPLQLLSCRGAVSQDGDELYRNCGYIRFKEHDVARKVLEVLKQKASTRDSGDVGISGSWSFSERLNTWPE